MGGVLYDVSRHAYGIGVSGIFRGWVRPGVDPGFLVRDDGGAKGPERCALGAKRRSAEGSGV